jgi:hypothetical protein
MKQSQKLSENGGSCGQSNRSKCVASLLKSDLSSTEETISETFQNQLADATRKNCLLKKCPIRQSVFSNWK